MVIQDFIVHNFPIYTLHDHFFTLTQSGVQGVFLAGFYINAFVCFLYPVYIVNRFLYVFIIRHSEYSNRLNSLEVLTFVERWGRMGAQWKRKGVDKTSHEFLTQEDLERVFKSLEPGSTLLKERYGMLIPKQ